MMIPFRISPTNLVMRICICIAVLLLVAASPRRLQDNGLSIRVNAGYIQSTFSNRFIILLDGINSLSSGFSAMNGDFEFIKTKLILAGLLNENIVYFSYGAAAGYQVGDLYCVGWKNACSTTGDLGDLIYLNLFPVYDKKDTHLPIPDQAKALGWLIEQIVKKEPTAQIDIIGFSQGGIIAAYWGSHMGITSPFRPNIHGIIALESPLGGIPIASQCIGTFTHPMCIFLRDHYGENLLEALQIPDTLPNSIVDELPRVADSFSFTSIQSTSDYTVNDLIFPVDLLVYGHQDVPIGRGSQGWIKSKQKLQNKLELGGKGLATSDLSFGDAKAWIAENHVAPLSNEKTLDLIIEVINSPTHNEADSMNPSEDVPITNISFWESLGQKLQNWWDKQRDNMEKGLDTWWQEQEKKVADRLDQWWQEQEKKIEDAINQWWQGIQHQLAEWFEQQLVNWLSQCFGSIFLPIGILTGVGIFRRRKL